MNDDRQQIYNMVFETLGEGGCAGSCGESELYQEDGEWKLFLCGFMEPWALGKTISEVEARLKEYAGQGFGL